MTLPFHKFQVHARNPDEAMTGANTEVYMDGVKLERCTRFAFEVDARGVAKVSLELLGNVAIAGLIGLQEQIVDPLVPKDKP